MRRLGPFGLAIALVLAGCSSTSKPSTAPTTSSSPHPASITKIVPPTTSVPPATTTTSIPRFVASPETAASQTFIETSWVDDRVAVARLSDGKVLQLLTPPRNDEHWTLHTEALRTRAGHLVTRAGYSWRDQSTGFTFAGDWPKLSPDGSQIATRYQASDGQQSIRRYDLATGRLLSELVVAKAAPARGILGFDWTPAGDGFVVATGTLHVVDLTTHVLSDQTGVVPVSPRSTHDAALWDLAVLADDHALAYLSTVPQRDAWSAELVDVNLRTGALRRVAGSVFDTGAGILLNTFTPIEARGDEALVTDGNHNTYAYDGHSLHKIATGNYSTRW